jgi:Flp pilus assembly protein TadG
VEKYAGHLSNSSRGQALIEFAFVALVLLMLLFGILEFGRAAYVINSLADAAREGARYGIMNPNDTSGIKTQASNAAIGLNLPTSNVTVTFPDGSSTSGNRIRVDVSNNFKVDTPLVSPNLTLKGSATMTIQ